MPRAIRPATPALLLAVLAACSSGRHPPRPDYPESRVADHADTYHGTKVPDPYRWLEDVESGETKAWVEKQNALTFSYLARSPARDRIYLRLRQLWNFERYRVPLREGGRYFFLKNDGLQNQDVLYTVERLDAAPRALVDPNAFSADGTESVAGHYPSPNGRMLAYATSSGGSDWNAMRVRDVATAKDLADRLQWLKFSGAEWDRESSGFYYGRFPAPEKGAELRGPNYFQKLYFHRIGKPQREDTLVYERPDQKEWGFDPTVTLDGRYLVLHVWRGSANKNAIFYKDAERSGEFVELLKDFDSSYLFLGNDGPVFWFSTDRDAPRGRIVAIDVGAPEREKWTELVPQSDDAIQEARVVGNRFVVVYLHDACAKVKLFDTTGKLERELPLPGIGSVWGFTGRRHDSETFYAFTSFTTPTAIYRYDFVTCKSEVFRRPQVAVRSQDFEVKQVFYKSKDGTNVPMFVVHRKGIALDGSNPTYLEGYGGFAIPETPRFSVRNLVWMEMGGIYAVPSVRGGGEYGEDWHQAGMKEKKQNSFDDFIAAAEWLVANGYTSPAKLAIAGGSNGGLLVGACLTQRPDLFGAALPDVGVMDMLRFHEFTIGWAWTSEYGSSADAREFPTLLAYSPLHNIRPGTRYPATLITTADHDDRVFPAHSFKFAAALQAAQSSHEPIFLRVQTRVGHGAGTPTQKRIEEATDAFTFLSKVLDMKLQKPFR
ncbi:MAG: prolyl oligopeptidase family serine peptidase [Planctomycetota bacterium]